MNQYGLQEDAAQDYSQISPFRKTKATDPTANPKAAALQGALSGGGGWGGAGLPKAKAATPAPQQPMMAQGRQAISDAASRLDERAPVQGAVPIAGRGPRTAAGRAARHYGMAAEELEAKTSGETSQKIADQADAGNRLGATYDTPISTPYTGPGAGSTTTTSSGDTRSVEASSTGDLTEMPEQPEDPIALAYKKYLGRDPGPEDYAAHRGNTGGVEGIIKAIQESPEAAEWAAGKAERDAAIKGEPQDGAEGNPLAGVDTSQWETEGWATPQYIGKAAGGPMAGWDQTNWNDPNMQTPKYVVGRILSNYPASPNGLRAAIPEIAKAYPGATIVEHPTGDQLSIPGLGTIDVGVSFDGSNPDAVTEWAWQDLTNGGGGGAAGGGGGGAPSWYSANQQMGGDAHSFIAQFLPELLKNLNSSIGQS